MDFEMANFVFDQDYCRGSLPPNSQDLSNENDNDSSVDNNVRETTTPSSLAETGTLPTLLRRNSSKRNTKEGLQNKENEASGIPPLLKAKSISRMSSFSKKSFRSFGSFMSVDEPLSDVALSRSSSFENSSHFLKTRNTLDEEKDVVCGKEANVCQDLLQEDIQSMRRQVSILELTEPTERRILSAGDNGYSEKDQLAAVCKTTCEESPYHEINRKLHDDNIGNEGHEGLCSAEIKCNKDSHEIDNFLQEYRNSCESYCSNQKKEQLSDVGNDLAVTEFEVSATEPANDCEPRGEVTGFSPVHVNATTKEATIDETKNDNDDTETLFVQKRACQIEDMDVDKQMPPRTSSSVEASLLDQERSGVLSKDNSETVSVQEVSDTQSTESTDTTLCQEISDIPSGDKARTVLSQEESDIPSEDKIYDAIVQERHEISSKDDTEAVIAQERTCQIEYMDIDKTMTLKIDSIPEETVNDQDDDTDTVLISEKRDLPPEENTKTVLVEESSDTPSKDDTETVLDQVNSDMPSKDTTETTVVQERMCQIEYMDIDKPLTPKIDSVPEETVSYQEDVTDKELFPEKSDVPPEENTESVLAQESSDTLSKDDTETVLDQVNSDRPSKDTTETTVVQERICQIEHMDLDKPASPRISSVTEEAEINQERSEMFVQDISDTETTLIQDGSDTHSVGSTETTLVQDRSDTHSIGSAETLVQDGSDTSPNDDTEAVLVQESRYQTEHMDTDKPMDTRTTSLTEETVTDLDQTDTPSKDNTETVLGQEKSDLISKNDTDIALALDENNTPHEDNTKTLLALQRCDTLSEDNTETVLVQESNDIPSKGNKETVLVQERVCQIDDMDIDTPVVSRTTSLTEGTETDHERSDKLSKDSSETQLAEESSDAYSADSTETTIAQEGSNTPSNDSTETVLVQERMHHIGHMDIDKPMDPIITSVTEETVNDKGKFDSPSKDNTETVPVQDGSDMPSEDNTDAPLVQEKSDIPLEDNTETEIVQEGSEIFFTNDTKKLHSQKSSYMPTKDYTEMEPVQQKSDKSSEGNSERVLEEHDQMQDTDMEIETQPSHQMIQQNSQSSIIVNKTTITRKEEDIHTLFKQGKFVTIVLNWLRRVNDSDNEEVNNTQDEKLSRNSINISSEECQTRPTKRKLSLPAEDGPVMKKTKKLSLSSRKRSMATRRSTNILKKQFPNHTASHIAQKKVQLFKAVEDDDLNTVRELLYYTGPSVRDCKKNTLLHTAAAYNQTDISIHLLNLISPNVINKDSQTPAHIAAANGHAQILKILSSDTQFDPDKRDDKQRTFKDLLVTPLFKAVLAGDKKEAETFLRLGADPDCHAGELVNGVLARELKVTTSRQLAKELHGDQFLGLFPQAYSPRCNDIYSAPMDTLQTAHGTVSNCESYVCVLNFQSFAGKPELDRKHSCNKISNLTQLFKNAGYRGNIHTSMSLDETRKAFTDLRNSDMMAKSKYAVFVISSYGSGKSFLTSDMKVLTTDWVMGFFRDSDCPQLKNKPKLFIFDLDSNFHLVKVNSRTREVTPRVEEPLSDMISLTSENLVTKGVPERYSFLAVLCQTLRRHGKGKDVVEVHRELIKAYTKLNHSSLPEISNFGFTGKLCLIP